MINYKGFCIISIPLKDEARNPNGKYLAKSIINVPRNSEVIFRRIDRGEIPIKKDEVPWGTRSDDTDKLYQYLSPHLIDN